MKIKRSDASRINRHTVSAMLKQGFVLCLGVLLVLQTQSVVVLAQEASSSQPSNQDSANHADESTPNVVEASNELPSAPEPRPIFQAQAAQQQTPPQQPVGTAAAPYEKPTGVSGSRPAGAAIAPAKQRRVRAIVIRVGLVLAGAGAVGAVVGLSKASHSQP